MDIKEVETIEFFEDGPLAKTDGEQIKINWKVIESDNPVELFWDYFRTQKAEVLREIKKVIDIEKIESNINEHLDVIQFLADHEQAHIDRNHTEHTLENEVIATMVAVIKLLERSES